MWELIKKQDRGPRRKRQENPEMIKKGRLQDDKSTACPENDHTLLGQDRRLQMGYLKKINFIEYMIFGSSEMRF